MDGFHTFALYWKAEEYVFFVDGKETWRTAAGGVSPNATRKETLMAKTKRHSAEQIIRKLREAETMLAAGKSVGDVFQTLGVSGQT
jgi:hypothetical protein